MRKIIDSHAHLGDIFHPMKNVTFKQNVKAGDFGEYHNIFIDHEENDYVGPLIDENDVSEYLNLISAGQYLSWENTLENVSKRLDESGISYIVMLPILPGNSFEEMLAASKLDPRIIPFTSVDFNLSIDEIEAKLRKDVKNGARGLKVHAVIQNIYLSDPKVHRAVETIASYDLPIVSHCGANDYYLPEMTYEREPEAGDVKYFIELAHQYPDVKLIAAHGGGLFGGEMEKLAEGTKGLKNVYTDTSFRDANDVLKAVKFFGRDKVMFGTDNPFGTHPGSLRQIDIACKDDPELAEMILFKNAAGLLKILA